MQGKITGFIYDRVAREHFALCVFGEETHRISVSKFDQAFFPVSGRILGKRKRGQISSVRFENAECYSKQISHTYFVARHFHQGEDGSHFWLLFAVFSTPAGEFRMLILNYKLVCGHHPSGPTEKIIRLPIVISPSRTRGGKALGVRMDNLKLSELIDSILDWQSENRLSNFVRKYSLYVPSPDLILAVYKSIADNITALTGLTKEKEQAAKDFLTKATTPLYVNRNHDLLVKALQVFRELIVNNYHYEDTDLLTAFFAFVELWWSKQKCNCIALLSEDRYSIYSVFPLTQIECICVVLARTSNVTKQGEKKMLFFAHDHGMGKLEPEFTKRMKDNGCTKGYIYSVKDYLPDIRSKNRQLKFLQFDCTLFNSPNTCNPECQVERFKQDIIIDYSSTIPKDHDWKGRGNAYYVTRDIFSHWKQVIGQQGLYGLFSIRKSGKSTSLKHGLGGKKVLYMNLMDELIDRDGTTHSIITYQFKLQEYIRLFISLENIKNGVKLELLDFDLVIIDEYERLFRGLYFEEVKSEEGRMQSETVASYIASLSKCLPVILSGQDGTWYRRIVPANNPLSGLTELKLDLFDLRDTSQLIRAIGRDSFTVDSEIVKAIHYATCGHPRIIINFFTLLIGHLAKEKIEKGVDINRTYFEKLFSQCDVDILFPIEKVMEPLETLFTPNGLEKLKNDEFHALVLHILQIYKDERFLTEEKIVTMTEENISFEKTKMLIEANFLTRAHDRNIEVKIPLLKNLFYKENRLKEYLLNSIDHAQ